MTSERSQLKFVIIRLMLKIRLVHDREFVV